jgi:hypothetical protein
MSNDPETFIIYTQKTPVIFGNGGFEWVAWR